MSKPSFSPDPDNEGQAWDKTLDNYSNNTHRMSLIKIGCEAAFYFVSAAWRSRPPDPNLAAFISSSLAMKNSSKTSRNIYWQKLKEKCLCWKIYSHMGTQQLYTPVINLIAPLLFYVKF